MTEANVTSTVKTNVLAIVSLVTSILGLGLVGVVSGHISLSQIKKTSESGRGLAVAGLILGYIGTLVGTIVSLTAFSLLTATPLFSF